MTDPISEATDAVEGATSTRPRSRLGKAGQPPVAPGAFVAGARRALLRRAALWTLAVTGWVVAAIFIIYSHGQSDRVRNTRHDALTQVADITAVLDGTVAIQHFLATEKNAQAVHLAPLQPLPAAAFASFLYGSGQSRGAVVVDALPAMEAGHFYAVWVRDSDKRWWLVGELTPSRAGAEASTLVTAPRPLDQYSSVSLNVEARTDVPSPTTDMLFIARLPAAPAVDQHTSSTTAARARPATRVALRSGQSSRRRM